MAQKIKVLFFEKNPWIRKTLSKSLTSDLKRQGFDVEIQNARSSREAWVMAENSEYHVIILSEDDLLPSLGADVKLSDRISRRMPEIRILIPHNEVWICVQGECRSAIFSDPAQIIAGLYGPPKVRLVR